MNKDGEKLHVHVKNACSLLFTPEALDVNVYVVCVYFYVYTHTCTMYTFTSSARDLFEKKKKEIGKSVYLVDYTIICC